MNTHSVRGDDAWFIRHFTYRKKNLKENPYFHR